MTSRLVGMLERVPYREQKGRVGADQVFIVDPDGHTWEFQDISAVPPVSVSAA